MLLTLDLYLYTFIYFLVKTLSQ